jgi:hypothetical protein
MVGILLVLIFMLIFLQMYKTLVALQRELGPAPTSTTSTTTSTTTTTSTARP